MPSGTLMKVRVYTSADEIQVLLNGAEIAVKRLTPADKMTTTFDVPYQPGTLTAIARRFGNEIARKEFTSVDVPYTLRLTPDARTHRKGRDSLAFVLVEVVDQHNRLVPDAVVQVSFTITGIPRNRRCRQRQPTQRRQLPEAEEVHLSRQSAAHRAGHRQTRTNDHQCNRTRSRRGSGEHQMSMTDYHSLPGLGWLYAGIVVSGRLFPWSPFGGQIILSSKSPGQA